MTKHLLVTEVLTDIERPVDFKECILTLCRGSVSKTMKHREETDENTIVTFRLADEPTQGSEESIIKIKETEEETKIQLEVHRYIDDIDSGRVQSFVQDDYQEVREVIEEIYSITVGSFLYWFPSSSSTSSSSKITITSVPKSESSPEARNSWVSKFMYSGWSEYGVLKWTTGGRTADISPHIRSFLSSTTVQ